MNPRISIVFAAILAAVGAPLASAQTPANVIVAAGNGQLICNLCTASGGPFSFQPVYALVTDANGNPIQGATVNWTVSGPGGIGATSSTTDASGTALVYPSLPQQYFNGGLPYQQLTITAQAGNITSSPFTETNAQVDQFGSQYIHAYFNALGGTAPLYGTLSGKAGTTGTAFTVLVGGILGAPPGVSVRLINADGTSGPSPKIPSAYCQTGPPINGSTPDPWSVLTDATGTATCTPVFGPVAGNKQVAVEVGGLPAGQWGVPGQGSTAPYNPGGVAYNADAIPPLPAFALSDFNISINVTQATVTSVTATGGNSQSALVGAALANPLVATVNGTSGPLAGQTVTWTVVPTGAVVFSSPTGTTNSSGQASTNVTFTAAASGAVTITATSGAFPATFTETAVLPVTIASLAKVAGDAQSAIVGAAFATPLEVQVTIGSGALANIPISFAVSSGPATLSATSANTNSSGIAQVIATAGATPGNVTVTATVSSMTVTFNLTVVPQGPTVTASEFVNGADQQKGSISACGIATLAASGVAPSVVGTLVAPLIGPLPYNLGGVTITFTGPSGSDPAPLLSVSGNAATFLVPCDLTAGSVPVTVSATGATTAINVTLLPASPGIFQSIQSDGVSRAVIERPDGSFVSLANPARLGENVSAFVTGLGPVTPPISPGTPLPAPGSAGYTTGIPSAVNGQVIVGVNNAGTEVLAAQLSPTQPGIYLVTFQIPQSAPQGSEVVQLPGGAVGVPFSIAVIPVGSSTPNYSTGSQIPVQ